MSRNRPHRINFARVLWGMALACLMMAGVPAFAQDDEALFNQAVEQYNQKDLDKALETFQNLLKKDQDNPGTLKWIGFIYLQKGKYGEAIPPLEKAAKLVDKDFEVLINLGNAYEGAARFDDAITTLEKAAKLNIESPDPYFNLGSVYFKQGEPDKALTAYKKAATLSNDSDAAVYQNIGNIHYNKQNWDEALDAYGKAAEIEPSNPRIARNYALMVQKRARDTASGTPRAEIWVRCKKAMVQAIRVDSNKNDYVLRESYAETLAEMDETEAAIPQFEAAIKIDATRYESFYNLGKSLARWAVKTTVAADRQSRFERALEAFRKAQELTDGNPDKSREVALGIGVSLAQLGKLSEAETLLSKAVKDMPDVPEAWLQLAILYQEQQAHEKSTQTLMDGVKQMKTAKQKSVLQRALGAFYFDQATRGKKPDDKIDPNLLSKAQQAYNQSLQSNPQNPEAYNGLGLTASRLGLPSNAMDHFQKALQLKPDYADAYNNLGAVYQSQKNKTEALRCYNKALQLDPDHPEAKKNRDALNKGKKKN